MVLTFCIFYHNLIAVILGGDIFRLCIFVGFFNSLAASCFCPEIFLSNLVHQSVVFEFFFLRRK
jgi:hypothetical protein